MLVLHLKIYRNNYFVIVSNTIGKTLFTKSSGQVGFNNIKKCSLDALKQILEQTFFFIIGLITKHKIYFKIEIVTKFLLYEIYKQIILNISKHKFEIPVLKIINKISHSGCKQKSK